MSPPRQPNQIRPYIQQLKTLREGNKCNSAGRGKMGEYQEIEDLLDGCDSDEDDEPTGPNLLRYYKDSYYLTMDD